MRYVIRPKVILAYCRYTDSNWSDAVKILNERDEVHHDLNVEFQYNEEGGNFTSSHARRHDAEYDRRYKMIDGVYSPLYESMISRKLDFKSSLDLTIYEYLYLDDYFSADFENICNHKRFLESHASPLIRMKADIVIDRWKIDANISGIKRRIDIERQLFHYAAKRCRNFFHIHLINFSDLIAIRQYRVDWIKALNESFGYRKLP
jgi:hypothetical protein